MLRLLLLVLGFLLHGSTAASNCIEKQRLDVPDCSGLGLKTTKNLSKLRQKEWVISLDLRRNKFVSLNFTEIHLIFPNLRLMDVRENPLFNCKMDWTFVLLTSWISHHVTILPSTPQPSSAAEPTSVQTSRPNTVLKTSSTPWPSSTVEPASVRTSRPNTVLNSIKVC